MKSKQDIIGSDSNETQLSGYDQCISKCKQKSKYFQQYNSFFNVPVDHCINAISQKLKENKIYYNPNHNQNQLNITVVYKSQNAQILTVSVSFSCFMFQLEILNYVQNSKIQDLNFIAKGSYGSIYAHLGSNDHNFAIKSIKYNFKAFDNFKTSEFAVATIQNAILQYCYYKLFSVLKIGPCVLNEFGFDLLIFGDSIEFCMQLCQKAKLQNLQQSLSQSLQLMHSLQIIHGDIKKQNFVWSPTYCKNVFIDFGFTRSIKEKIGQKSLTHYFGTFQYCSLQMKQLFQNSQMGFVDLYYNDLFCLKKTFQQNKVQNVVSKKGKRNMIEKHKRKYNNFLENVKLSFMIFQRDQNKIKQFVFQHKKTEIFKSTLELFLEFGEEDQRLQRIGKLLFQEYCLDKQYNYLNIGSYFKEIECQQNYRKKKLVFQNRVRQVSTSFSGSFTDVMLFMYIFYCEDVTPNALNKSLGLKESLMKSDGVDYQVCKFLIEYSNNCYTSMHEFSSVLQCLIDKMNLGEKYEENVKQFIPYAQARTICKQIYKIYGINLFDMHRKWQQIKPIRIYQQQLQFLKSYSDDFPYDQFFINLKQKNQQNNKNLNMESPTTLFKQTLKFWIEKHKESNQKIPVPVELMSEAINLTINLQGYEGYVQIQNFLEKLSNFEAVKKACGITGFREIIMKQKRKEYEKNEYINIYRNFYKNTTNLCFDLYANLTIYLYDSILSKIEEIKERDDVICKKLYEIVDYVFIFGSQEIDISILFRVLLQFTKFYKKYCYQKLYESDSAILVDLINYVIMKIDGKIPDLVIYEVSTLVYNLPVNKHAVKKQGKREIINNIFFMPVKINGKNDVMYYLRFLLQRISIKREWGISNLQAEQEELTLAFSLIEQHNNKINPSLKISVLEQITLHYFATQRDASKFIKNMQCILFENPLILKLSFQSDEIGRIMFCIAIYYALRSLNEYGLYFDYLLDFVERSSNQINQLKGQFYIYTCLRELVEKYFYWTLSDMTEIKNCFLGILKEKVKSKTENFCLKYGNILTVIECFFKEFFRSFYNIKRMNVTKEDIYQLCKIAHYLTESSNYFIKKSFIGFMNIWCLRFEGLGLIDYNENQFRVKVLKMMRNSRQFCSRAVLENVCLKKRGKNVSIRFFNNVRGLFMSKIQKVLKNQGDAIFDIFTQYQRDMKKYADFISLKSLDERFHSLTKKQYRGKVF